MGGGALARLRPLRHSKGPSKPGLCCESVAKEYLRFPTNASQKALNSKNFVLNGYYARSSISKLAKILNEIIGGPA